MLVVDKPPGPTSHDVVDRVRAILRLRRVGHTGTLDPFASGVLPLCLGKATRLATHVAHGDKLYRATVRFGFATTTDDLTGEPLAPACHAAVDADQLRAACTALTGTIPQYPPAYSAKHIQGRRAYQLAREGLPVERAAVRVTVHGIQIIEIAGDTAQIEVRCATGTYIRALARDLGTALGVGGHVIALRRLACGVFTIDNALAWERLAGEAHEHVLPLRRLLADWPAVRVGPEGVSALRHGRDLTARLVLEGFPTAAAGRPVRVLDETGDLVALASPRGYPSSATPAVEASLHPDTVLLDP